MSLLAQRARLHSFRNGAPSTAGHVICLAGAGAKPSQFAELARACAGRWPVHAFHAFDFSGVDFSAAEAASAPQAADIAEAFAACLRETAPPPYRLIGHSAGAFVAYALACRLKPHEWQQLLIVDSYLPTPGAPRAEASHALDAFVSAMVQQLPALRGVQQELHAVAWNDAPAVLSDALRRHGMFLPAREIAARMAHYRSYTGFRFQPQGGLPGQRSRLVVATDECFAEHGHERRSTQWHAGFDAAPALHRLPGNHFSLLRRPNVDALAALIA